MPQKLQTGEQEPWRGEPSLTREHRVHYRAHFGSSMLGHCVLVALEILELKIKKRNIIVYPYFIRTVYNNYRYVTYSFENITMY